MYQDTNVAVGHNPTLDYTSGNYNVATGCELVSVEMELVVESVILISDVVRM